MVAQINQIIAILILGSSTLFFLYCLFVSGKRPTYEVVMKIYSFIMLLAVSVILILSFFFPDLHGWIKQSILPITIVAILTITIALQILWKGKSRP